MAGYRLVIMCSMAVGVLLVRIWDQLGSHWPSWEVLHA